MCRSSLIGDDRSINTPARHRRFQHLLSPTSNIQLFLSIRSCQISRPGLQPGLAGICLFMSFKTSETLTNLATFNPDNPTPTSTSRARNVPQYYSGFRVVLILLLTTLLKVVSLPVLPKTTLVPRRIHRIYLFFYFLKKRPGDHAWLGLRVPRLPLQHLSLRCVPTVSV